jgi:hypothetical protein
MLKQLIPKKLNFISKYLLWFVIALLTTLTCVASNYLETGDFSLAKQEILLRKIGHEILLNSGDSTSRVLPIRKINNNEYQIRFENEFSFEPDTLVNIIKHELAKDKLVKNYIVNVIGCSSKEVVYGYAIFSTKKDDIVACVGRKQPKACYLINIKLQNVDSIAIPNAYLIGSIAFLLGAGLLTFKGISKKTKFVGAHNMSLKIGDTLFNPEMRSLFYADTTTALTMKENKLLLIFAKSPNVIIERNKLQKEIWEDEGVIVSRSLDMFISKLRKKLENDLSIKLTNIHGKGYKLEI